MSAIVDIATSALLALGFTAVPTIELIVIPDNNPISKNTNVPVTNEPSHEALMMAHKAYQWAKTKGHSTNKVMTIVDFSQPRDQKRLYVINMETNEIIYKGYTASGKNSGRKAIPTKFSNTPRSKKSSLGLFKTAHTYQGKHGYSLRLVGLEKGLNHNAAKRVIVLHPAKYTSKAYVKRKGGSGFSWGCFTLDPKESRAVINKIKGGSLIFAYAPQLLNSHNYGSIPNYGSKPISASARVLDLASNQ